MSRIAPRTVPGPVHLTVSDLGRSVEYYREAVGLELLEQGAGRASLGTGGRELLVLDEEPGARSSRGHTGLYHFALLVPERVQLAAWLAHAARDGVPLVGLSDPARLRHALIVLAVGGLTATLVGALKILLSRPRRRQEPTRTPTPATVDAFHQTLARLGLDCVLWGPGSIDVAHKPDEFLPVNQFVEAGRILDEAIVHFAGKR